MQEGLTRNIGHSRFLEVASFSQGLLINVSEVARDAHIQRTVAESYFSIPEDLLIGIRLPVFSRRAKRQLVTHAKFYYFDAGVFRAIRPAGPLRLPAEIDGPLPETLMLQELRTFDDYRTLGYDIHFWRIKNGLEIDFVLYGPSGLVAIEVKRSGTINPKDLRRCGNSAGLPAGALARCFMLYTALFRRHPRHPSMGCVAQHRRIALTASGCQQRTSGRCGHPT